MKDYTELTFFKEMESLGKYASQNSRTNLALTSTSTAISAPDQRSMLQEHKYLASRRKSCKFFLGHNNAKNVSNGPSKQNRIQSFKISKSTIWIPYPDQVSTRWEQYNLGKT